MTEGEIFGEEDLLNIVKIVWMLAH